MIADASTPNPLTRLRRQMADTLSLDDLRTLYRDLPVRFDDLPDDDLNPKICNLITQLHTSGRLPDLHAWLVRAYPEQA